MLFKPFTFPNGTTAKNRFFKSAMEEQLAIDNQPTQALVNLYCTWAKGGAGVLVTGNVMVSPNGKGSVGDVVVSDDRSLPMLKAWADAGKTAGTLMIMQINHAGKQSPKVVNREPVAPSAVHLSEWTVLSIRHELCKRLKLNKLLANSSRPPKSPNKQDLAVCKFTPHTVI
ncbi:hypothetical protein [Wielerella bovis]|uniref:oxidoreductase n=1 Tax=Wielerella bovis TaxID=2917790 RepID=UPI0024B736FF|nr:hypothetical protein [Wielerella bovis]